MFGRKKDTPAPEPDEQVHPHREGAKNRPTPTRKESQAARKRPLVEDPKEAKRRAKLERREAYSKQREAMYAGQDSALPARDRGPVRRYVRDVVDGRIGVGEVLLPIMLVVLVVSAFAQTWAGYLFITVYILMIYAVIDAVVLYYRTKPKLKARFGNDVETKGLGWYLAMRTFQYRQLRVPRPGVDRGQPPR